MELPIGQPAQSVSSSNSISRPHTPQEQLAERRERLKRKAEHDLQGFDAHAAGYNAPSISRNRDRKSESWETFTPLGSHEKAPEPPKAELDLDMLLDGLGMDESLKTLAKDDPTFREDLIRQLMTVPVPENWPNTASGTNEAFDLEDSDNDEAGELGEYGVNDSIFCGYISSASLELG